MGTLSLTKEEGIYNGNKRQAPQQVVLGKMDSYV